MSKTYTDKPASVESEDQFQRYEFSKRIASIVSSPSDDKSLVIGLYGKWGEGKTSVMNFIRAELPKETVVVNFNPWLFSDEKHLLKSFFDSLANALQTSIKNPKEKFGELLYQYADAIGTLSKWIGYPLNPDGLKDVGKELDTPLSLESIKNRIDESIVKSNKKIVVFIDDIDRLDVSEIQYVFKLVKLVGDFPRTSYVLSFDNEMVSAALGPRYAGNDSIAGYNYLEKIIQIPILLPKASKRALRKFTLDLLTEVINKNALILNDQELAQFIDVFDNSFLPQIDNPRSGIRYANAALFSIPLLKGEVNHGDLLAIEGVKVLYPELYSHIRNNKRIYLNLDAPKDKKHDEEGLKNRILDVIGTYDIIKQNGATEYLINAFPQLSTVLNSNSYLPIFNKHEDWLRDKRICSGKYFDRYFSYTLEPSEISDKVFDSFLEEINTSNEQVISDKLLDLINIHSAFDLIQMIRVREEILSENQLKLLGHAITSIGSQFPKEQDLPIATSFVQSIRMLTRFVRRIPKQDDQLKFAIELIEKAETVEYASEIQLWFLTPENTQIPSLIFSEKQQDLIKNAVVKKFRDQMNFENFFDLIPNGNQTRLLQWWNASKKERKSFHDFLNNHIANPEFALNFLKMATPSITSFSSNAKKSHTFKSGFTKPEYEILTELVDTEKLNEALIPNFGMSPYTGDISQMTRENFVELDDKTLVSIFQWYLTNQ